MFVQITKTVTCIMLTLMLIYVAASDSAPNQPSCRRKQYDDTVHRNGHTYADYFTLHLRSTSTTGSHQTYGHRCLQCNERHGPHIMLR